MAHPTLPRAPKTTSRLIWLTAGCLVAAIAMALPAPPGLTGAGQRALAITLLATMLWTTEALPLAATGLGCVALLSVVGATPTLGESLSGFARPVPYFLYGVLVLGVAAGRSGLAERVARWFLRLAGGRPTTLYWQLICSFAALAFLLPSASTRTGVQLPVYHEALLMMKSGPGTRLGSAVMQAQAQLNRMGSNAILTGGITPVTAAALLGGLGWGEWFALMAIPVYANLVFGAIALYLTYRPFEAATPPLARADDVADMDSDPANIPGPTCRDARSRVSTADAPGLAGRAHAVRPYAPDPPSSPLPRPHPDPLPKGGGADGLSPSPHREGGRGVRSVPPAELRTAAILLGVSFLWLTDSWHHLDPALPALLGAILLVTPGIGVLSWAEVERGVGVSLVFVMAASLSLADAVVSTGAAAWIGEGLIAGLRPFAGTPLLLVTLLLVAVLVVRLLLSNITAYLVIVIPVVWALAETVGLNPLVCGLLVTLVGDAVLFYAAQSSSSLMPFEYGYLTGGEVFRFGLVMSLVAILVALLIALPYWALLGHPLVLSAGSPGA